MINTLEYSQELIDAGVDEKVAKVQANALVKAIEKSSATKEDITRLEGEIKLNRWMIGLVIVIEVLPFLKTWLGN